MNQAMQDPAQDGAPFVNEFLASGQGRRGQVGSAASVLVEAAAITRFAVAWLERRFG